MSINPLVREYLLVFVCGLPFILAAGRLAFGSWSGFFEGVRFLLTPDFISMLRGEWGEDQFATAKILLFVFVCGLAVYSAHRYFFGQ